MTIAVIDNMFNLIKIKRNKSKPTNQHHHQTCHVQTIETKTNSHETILVIQDNKNQDHIDENNNNNNNDTDDYYGECEYNSHETVDGRISGASRESAFSSGPSDSSSDSLSSTSSCGNNQSGRSSAFDSSSSDDFEPNQKLIFLLGIIRDRTLSYPRTLLNGDENNNQYDRLDIQELLEPIRSHNLEYHLAYKLIMRYLDQLLKTVQFVPYDSITSKSFIEKNEDEIKKASNHLSDLLKFRKTYRLNHLTVEDFPREFFQLNGIYTFGHDKENTPVLYISAHVHRKWSPKLDELFKCYVAWHVNRVTGSTIDSGQKLSSFVMCFDCDQIGYTNIDIEFLKFLVTLLLNHYPRFCNLCLIKDNPWVFRSIWTLVKSWLTDEARSAVHLITAQELTNFISYDQIPNSMKVNDLKDINNKKDVSGRFKFPDNFIQMKTLDDFADKLEINHDELKRLKAHVAKIEKEYLELGAIVERPEGS